MTVFPQMTNDRREALKDAREARKRPRPAQRCQHHEHGLLTPSFELKKVYYETGDGERTPLKLCYEWWCVFCREYGWDEISDWDEGWPVGDDGKFMTPIQCERIPGLDS